MPKLRSASDNQKIFLPSTENEVNEADRAWVVIKSKMQVKDMAGMFDTEGALNQTANALAAIIEDWNFTDEAGNKEPINSETVLLLDMGDFGFIMDKMAPIFSKIQNGLSVEEKKTSISTSTIKVKDSTSPLT